MGICNDTLLGNYGDPDALYRSVGIGGHRGLLIPPNHSAELSWYI